MYRLSPDFRAWLRVIVSTAVVSTTVWAALSLIFPSPPRAATAANDHVELVQLFALGTMPKTELSSDPLLSPRRENRACRSMAIWSVVPVPRDNARRTAGINQPGGTSIDLQTSKNHLALRYVLSKIVLVCQRAPNRVFPRHTNGSRRAG